MPSLASLQLCFCLCSAHSRARPSSKRIARVLRWECSLAQQAVLQPTPGGCSTPVPAARCQLRPTAPSQTPSHRCSPPAALRTVPQFPLLKTDRVQGTAGQGRLGGLLGTGRGARDPPSHHRYIKPAAALGTKGSPASRRCCQRAKAGGWGHVRAGQMEQERARGRETAPWHGQAAGSAAEPGPPWHGAQSCLCASPGPPRSAGNGTGWLSGAGWQPGQGPPPPPAARRAWGPDQPARGASR